MSMTKKDFKAIAEIIRQTREFNQVFANASIKESVTEQIRGRLSDYCASQNSAFDRESFVAACNPTSVASKPIKLKHIKRIDSLTELNVVASKTGKRTT